MEILVTGANGRLGSAIAERREITGLSRSGADILADVSDESVSQKIERAEPDAVVHAAAMHANECEENPGRAREVNVRGTENVARAVESIDARMVFISSEHVFSGDKEEKYSEDDEKDTNLVYGETKIDAERKVREICSDWTILRSAIMYGADESGEASSGNFFSWARNDLKQGNRVDIITDQVNTPIYIPKLAEIILESIDRDIDGLFNAGGKSSVSRYEAVKKLKKIHDLDGELNPITRADLGWEERGENYALDTSRLEKNFENKPLSIEEGFRRWRRRIEKSS
ncbi:MAG: NAD(P)-dependent oxidoreductase [Candidatus Nanohaloarchaea archaeon]